jgi:GT2 family glycosyltransferase
MELPGSSSPLVSIIIPVFNLWDYTLRCLLSVKRHTEHIPHEVIVVDDNSSDDTREGLPLLQGLRLIRNEVNQGFSCNNNKAAAVARGKYLLFLNNDTEVHAGWLDEMLKVIESDTKVGMVGSKLLFPDGTIQHAGVAFSFGAFEPISPFHIQYKKPASESTEILSLNAVTAACALMPRELFLSLGGFDEGFRMGYEDVDLCLRVRTAGYRIVYTPHSVVTHFESLSAGRFIASRRNVELLHHNWLGRMKAYESDFRTVARPVVSDPSRAGCSIVVAVHDHLSSVAPCLENIWFTMGPQDELVIVDDGSVGATAKYLRLFVHEHPERTKLLRLDHRRGLAQAWLAGLQTATKTFAVTLVCMLRVLDGWLGRVVGHLQANPNMGALCGLEADGEGMLTQLLLAPIAKADGGLALPNALIPGCLQSCDFLVSGMVAASRAQLLSLISSEPQGVPGGHPQLWQRSLQRQGLTLAVASDVTVYPLNQLFPSSGAEARLKYLENQTIALDQRGTQGPLISVVVIARDFANELDACLAALFAQTPGPWQIIVVDDGSETSLQNHVQAAFNRSGVTPPQTAHFLRNEALLGWPAAVNRGLSIAQGQVVVVCNGDVLVTPRWLLRMNALLQVNSQIGVVAPVANVGPRPQSCDQPNFTQPPLPVNDFADQRAPDVFCAFGGMPRVAGFCMAIKRSVIDAVGGFDPRYEDTGGDVEDYCLRVTRSGYLIALASEAYVEHLGLLSQRWLDLHPRRAAPEGWRRFCARWGYPTEWSDTDGLSRIFTAEPPFNKTTDFVELVP